MLLRFDGAVKGVEGPVSSVEVHVDLIPPDIRRWKYETTNGMNMVGCPSVRFLEGKLPVIKVSKDKTIFKMYAINHSSWEIDKVKQMSKKTDGKGNVQNYRSWW